MPAGYSSRCKICNSRHRAEVERWIKEEGLSFREASRRLEELGERVSHVAIRRHCEEHFDVRAEVREQYEKSQRQIVEFAKKRLDDIGMLDANIAENFELSQATTAWLKDLIARRERLPLALVQLREKLQSEMRQAMKQRQELLGDDPESKKADAIQSLVDLMMLASDADD